MRCDKCGNPIEKDEEREIHGQVLCEDCYMDALSPVRTCDPWAVHTAKSLVKEKSQLSQVQKMILHILRDSDGMEPKVLSERLRIRPSDLEREVAALRHMEMVRGELREGKKFIILW
jgi:hypothetical protein